MKLFKSLLVAPATLGLLAPIAATANEVTFDDFNPAEELAITNSRVDGLEARLNNFEAGGFSETTSASFSVDASTMMEAYYSYPMNDGMTITPLIFTQSSIEDGVDDTTGVMVKTSFSF